MTASKNHSRMGKGISEPDEQIFRHVFEGHSAIMFLVEPHTGAIIDANLAALAFYGYSRSEICSMSIDDINVLPLKQVEAERNKSLSGEQSYFVFSQRMANGEERIVEVNSSVITLQNKQLLVSIVHDITERKRAEDSLRRRTDELTSLQSTILDISSPHSLSELLNLIVERAANLLDASSGGLYLTEPEHRKVRCVVSYKTLGDFTGTLLDFGVGAAGVVAETGKPLIIDDYRIWAGRANVFREGQPFQAVMSAPLLWQGEVSGVIHVLRDDISKKFSQDELNLLLLFANHAAVAVENARLFNLVNRELSERKQAENLLETTHKNYETFFNSIDDFLFVLDDRGNIIHINKTVTNRLGYSEEELIGQSVLMVHPPERRQEAGKIVGEMLAGMVEYCPVPLLTKSGERIPVETRVTPGFWNDKPAIFGVTKDLSQIKLSEEKFSKAFQSNSALMALSRLEDGIYIDVNDVFLNTLGYTRGEIIGKKSTELKLFADSDRRRQVIEIILKNGSVKDVEVVVRKKDGSLLDGLFSADLIYIGKDQCLLTVMVDITERNQAERTLRENEARFRSLFDDSPISLWEENFSAVKRRLDELRSIGVVDFETYLSQHPEFVAECVALVEVLDVNKATLNLYGAASKGHLVTNLAASLPEAGNEYFRDELVLIASGALHFEMEMIARTMDGKMLTVNLNWAVIPGYEDDLSRIIVSIIDITERKRAELELKTLLDIMQGLVVAQDLKDFLSLVHQSIAKVVDAENFFVILYNTETAMFEEVYSVDKFDPPAPPSQLENSISAYVFRTGEPLLLTDAGFDELKSQGKLKLVGSKMCSWLGVPLKTSSETIGVMVVQNYDHANRYSERDSAFLFSIAGQVALAVERKQADEALHKSEERYRTLFDSMMDGIYRSSHEGKFVDINPAMVKMFGFSSREEMMTVDIKKDLYFAPEERGSHILDTGQKQIDVYRMRRKDGSEIWVEDHGYYVHDEKGDILYHEGMLRDITGRKQAEDELRFAKETLDTAHEELERSFLREQKLAHIDELTGINNRRSLFELARHEFNVSKRYRPLLAILMFDIDNFKKMNDTFGHVTGDQVLICVTQIISDQLRSADIIGRYGGDEFVILLPQSSVQEAQSLAERIHNTLAVTRIKTDKGPLAVTISIGITQTIHNTLQPDSVETLFLRADQALYAAKQAGRNRTVVFEE